MFAHTQQFEWNNITLTLNRFALLVASLWVFWTTLKVYRTSKDVGYRLAVVPTPVLWFTMFWSGILAVFILELIVFDQVAVSEGFLRVFYAFAITWTMVGVTWILHIGAKAVRLGRAMGEVERVVKADEGG